MAWGRWRQVARPSRALLRAHRPLAVLVVLCMVVVATLGVRYAGHTTAGSLDAHVDGWVQGRLGITSPTLTALTWLGDPLGVSLITVLTTLGCLLARWWRGAVLAALAPPLSAVLTEDILKPIIGRTISGDLSMPSGHTTAVFTMATMAAVLLSHPPSPLRRLLIVAAYLLATAVAVAMVAQGFHYFTDTIGGAAVGTATVLIGAFVIDAAAGPVHARLRRPMATQPGPARQR